MARRGNYRGSGTTNFKLYLEKLLGGKPTQGQLAAALAIGEYNPISKSVDRDDIFDAIYNRAGREKGNIDINAYDFAAFRRMPGTNRAGYHSLAGKRDAILELANRWDSHRAGKTKPGHTQTHYYHPSGMSAIYRRQPSVLSRATKRNWRTVPGAGSHPAPTWANYSKDNYFTRGTKHGGFFTTPTHLVGKAGWEPLLAAGEVKGKTLSDIVKTISAPDRSPVRTVPPVQVAKNEIKPPPPGRMGAGLKDVIPPPPDRGPLNLKPILSPEEQKTYVAGPATTPVSSPVQTVSNPAQRADQPMPVGTNPVGTAGIASPAMITNAGRSAPQEAPVAKIDEEEVIPVVPNKVGEVNRDIDSNFARDADGRIVGVRVATPEQQVAEIEARYGGVGDRRRALAQELFQAKPMNWGQRIGGGLEQIGAAIAMAQGGPGAQWGSRVLGGNSIYGKHADAMSALESKLRGHEFDVADQSIVSGANESAALYKKMREDKAAARQKANNILQIYVGPDGLPTEKGIRSAAAALSAAGLTAEAKDMIEGFKAETAATPEQIEAAEADFYTGKPTEGEEALPSKGFELDGKQHAYGADTGVYGVGTTVDPAEAKIEEAQKENVRSRSAYGGGVPAGSVNRNAPRDMQLAQLRANMLYDEAKRAGAVGEKGIAAAAKEEADRIMEQSGAKDFASSLGKELAKNMAANTKDMTTKERFEFNKEIVDYSTKVEGQINNLNRGRDAFNVLFKQDEKTGKRVLRENAKALFGNLSGWLEAPPMEGSEVYDAYVAFNHLKSLFATTGLQQLREAGVAPGNITENEWKLFISRFAAMDRGMSPEMAERELGGALDLFNSTEDVMVKKFNKTYSPFMGRKKDGDMYGFYEYSGVNRRPRLGEKRVSAPQSAPPGEEPQVGTQAPVGAKPPRTSSKRLQFTPSLGAQRDESGRLMEGSEVTHPDGRLGTIHWRNGKPKFKPYTDQQLGKDSTKNIEELGATDEGL